MTLADRYRFFKEHAGYIVGESAVCAMRLARAEETAERRGLVVVFEEESEIWDADVPPPKLCVIGAVFKADDVDEYHGAVKNKGAHCYASLGMIGLDSMRDAYVRVVSAEMFVEALDELDKEDAEDATVLAARATYAAGGAS